MFVKVAWPWEWTEQGRRRRQEERERVQREVEDTEGRFEKMVMGEECESGRVSQWMLDREGYG